MAVSEETQKQMNAVKALVNVYDLLNVGQFQGNFSARLLEAQKFIKALHEQSFKDLQAKDDYEELIKEQSNEQKES